MRKILMTSVLAAIAGILLTAGNAAAADVLEVKVPFPFIANGHSFPAGQYTIVRAAMGDAVWLIRGESGNTASGFIGTRPAARQEQSPTGNKPSLQFTRYENTYKLSTVWESAA